jgi:hypothetical protein
MKEVVFLEGFSKTQKAMLFWMTLSEFADRTARKDRF